MTEVLYRTLSKFINDAIKIILYTMMLTSLLSFIRVLGRVAVNVVEKMPQPIVYEAKPLSEVQQIYALPRVVTEYIADISLANISSVNTVSLVANTIASIIETSLANLSSTNSLSLVGLSSTNSVSIANLSSTNSLSIVSVA